VTFGRPGANTTRADQTTVRRANLGVVLRHVARERSCSRARIAAETGLTRGTVSSLVAELIELELVREAGEDARPGRVGRPAQPLELADVAVAVGLDINVDYLAVRVEDLTGSVRHEERAYRDNRGASPAAVLDALAAMAEEALLAAAADGARPVGMAVAVPGLVRVASGLLLRAPNLGWEGVAIADELCDRLDTALPISVENESNLAALAEHRGGAARGLASFVCVFGEVGVGGGIFVDGRLFRGAHGFGGELGHMTVDPRGPACGCGSKGCLETYVGQEAIARRAGVPIEAGARRSSLTEELVRRAHEDDPAVLASLAGAAATLGTALASALNLLDVEAVVLGGCFGPLAPWLSQEVARALDEHVISADWSPCDVRASAFGEGAAVRGAAALTLSRILEQPWLVTAGTAGQVPA
jgi:predicted NBD/HSP70 family sugar kinase